MVEVLKKSEELHRDLFETARDIIYVLAPDGRIILLSPAWETVTGFTTDEWMGKQFAPLIHPDDLPFLMEIFQRTLRGESTPIFEARFITKSGEYRTGEFIINAQTKNKRVISVMGHGRDITERKKAEEDLQKAKEELELRVEERTGQLKKSEKKYRELIEHAMDIICTHDAEGYFTSINPAVEEIMGYKPIEIVGTNFTSIAHPDDLPALYEIYKHIMNGESVPFSSRFLAKSGATVWVEGVTIPILEDGKVIGWNGIAKDITERKKAEEEMKRRLMKYSLEDGNQYLVKESLPNLSLEAFRDILNIGYPGLVISRTPEKDFKDSFKKEPDFLWLAEKGGEKVLPPEQDKIESIIENLPRKTAVLIDRLDYLISKNGFTQTLFLIQRLRETIYLKAHIIILSIDPATLSKKEITLLEKETREIEPLHKAQLPDDFLEILRFIYMKNNRSIKPSITEVGNELKISRPTVRKRIRLLVSEGYLRESVKGNRKAVELTENGNRLFFK